MERERIKNKQRPYKLKAIPGHDPIAESTIYESLGGSVIVGRKEKLNQNVDAHSPE